MKLILAEELESGMTLAQDLFLSEDDASPFISRGIILNDYVIEKIKKRGFRNAYVENASGEKEERASTPQSLPVLDPELRDEALDTLEDMFTTFSSEDVHEAAVQVVKRLDKVVDQMVDSILSERNALVNINDLKSYDDYTYHHSLSVAVLALSMGHRLGYNHKRLNELGMCAMMHDIGKTAIPVEIIRKTTRLDSNELNLIKTHSTAGYSYLTKANIGNEDIWQGVLGHHEKMDGTGYPYGLKGKDISEWSRIISVADVYDALTSNRPYRKPMEPAEAIEYIMGGSGSSFDFDMVQALVKKIDLYPVGSRVELSNGKFAEVVDNENQMRPIIRIEDTGEVLDLFRDRSCLSIVIKRIVDETVLS
ncbi:HD-GYP domain-containing protein [Ruminococcaceae bacterium OttesenSCG-928-I18]|nr:HD-GYP domain-containing protein [Ruminococcaceae bacterium OttesenSCG-928-I18]